jgi:hypothetical protein
MPAKKVQFRSAAGEKVLRRANASGGMADPRVGGLMKSGGKAEKDGSNDAIPSRKAANAKGIVPVGGQPQQLTRTDSIQPCNRPSP